MVLITLPLAILLISISLLGSFIGSILSGGSLIIFTTLALVDIPIQTAVGTLKFLITVLGLFSAGTYLREGVVDTHLAVSIVIPSLFGSFIGSQLILSLPENTLKIIVIILLSLGTVFSSRQTKKRNRTDNLHKRLWSVFTGLLIGVYIGMLGIASTILTISLLTILFPLQIVQANGTAKMIIFANNLVASINYALHGALDFPIGILMSVPIAIGSWIGAKTAIKIGNPRLKVIYVCVTVATMIKLLTELLG
jgi:uncharacterized membrane protein YfcA